MNVSVWLMRSAGPLKEWTKRWGADWKQVGEVSRGGQSKQTGRLHAAFCFLPAYMSTVNSLYYGSGSVQLTIACLPWLAFRLAGASPPPLSLVNTPNSLTERAVKYTRSPLCKEKCEGGPMQRKRRNNCVVSRQHAAWAQTSNQWVSHSGNVCVCVCGEKPQAVC